MFINMATPFEHRHESESPVDDLWKAVNTPVSGEVAASVYPWFNVAYLFLDEEARITQGTTVRFAPNTALLDRLKTFGLSDFPELPFTVEEFSAENMIRTDVLAADEATGRVTQHVKESEGGSGLLVVEGELAIKGFMGSMAEGPAIKYAIERPTEQLANRVPEILRQTEL
jgi:hypothetical protein